MNRLVDKTFMIRPSRALLALGLLAMVAVACGSSDTTNAPVTSAATTTTAAATTTSAATTTTVASTSPLVDYAKTGPFVVESQQSTIPDDGEGRPVPITMWYPGEQQDSAGPYPLLILSPGLGGPAIAYSAMAEHLASYGFVVVGANHGDQFQDAAGATIALLYDRPRDVMRAIEYAGVLTADDGALAGLIDTEQIAVVGHSSGGTTALQAGGARVDFPALVAWCAERAERIDPMASETCQFVGQRDVLAAKYGVESSSADPFPALWDSRVDALVAMAPGGELHAFGDAGIAAVQVPTMILVGTNDEYVSPEYNAYWAYDHIGSTNKTLVKLELGTHLMFAESFGYDVNPAGPGSEDPKAYLTTAFLLDILKGDSTAHTALLADAVAFDNVEYTTTQR